MGRRIVASSTRRSQGAPPSRATLRVASPDRDMQGFAQETRAAHLIGQLHIKTGRSCMGRRSYYVVVR
jgi:hypothetical protein